MSDGLGAVLERYAAAIDARSLVDLEEVLDVHAILDRPGGVLTGRAAVVGFFSDRWAGDADRGMHRIYDVRVEQRHVEASYAATFLSPDGEARAVWGSYRATMTGDDDSATIASLRIAVDRVTEVPRRPHQVRPELDHVGIVVKDLRRTCGLLVDELGGRLIGGGTEPGTGLQSAIVDFPGGGKVELLSPTRPGPVADFLADRGEGVHHLTVLVEDIPETVDRLGRAGFRSIGLGEPEPSWHEAYVHPRDAAGCLVQLVRPGPRYGEPVSITIDEILADKWEWHERAPRRKA